MVRPGLKSELNLGLVVIIVLTVLTEVEFFVPIGLGKWPALPILTLLAVLKAGQFVYFFMHVTQIWRRGEE